MANVVANAVQLQNTVFTENTNITSVNLSNVPFVNNDAALAFSNCANLTDVTNLNNGVTNIGGTFLNCSNLVNAPTIPESVTNTVFIENEITYYGYDLSEPIFSDQMYETFYNIYLLTDTPASSGEVYVSYYDQLQSIGNYILNQDDTITISGYGVDATVGVTRNSTLDQTAQLPEYQWNYYGAFTGCSNLVNAPVLEEGITNIDYMFYDVPNLSSVTIPHSVQSINNSFYNCASLSTIILNTNATDLTNAFSGCINLTDAEVVGNETTLNGTFRNCNNLVNVTLGENITNLPYTFYGCNSLTNITIPNSVTNLFYTFGYCINMTDTPTIPDSVTSLSGTFSGCSSLVNVHHLGNNVTSLGSTFSSCTGLTSVAVPDEITSLYSTFYGCTNLTEITSWGGASGNMNNVCQQCTNLTTVADIPNTVTGMYNTFVNCTNLVEIPNLPQGINLGATFTNTGVNNVNKLFQCNPVSLWDVFSSCQNITSVEMDVPSSVTTMSGAFISCTNLQYFNGQIPTSVTGMQWAFQGCRNLKALPNVPSSVTSIFNTFKWCNSWNGTVYIDSTNITNATNAFFLTSVNATVNTRKVYIYFTYTNGQYTKTYNALTKAGYSASTLKHGVKLYNRGSHN